MAAAESDQDLRVEALQQEVERLQLKLHELHATDVNVLRRGYATVAQHVAALKLEAERLEALVDELEPELFPPEYVAEELGKAALVSGATYALFKLVKTITPLPSKAARWLRDGLVAVTALVVTWRFAASSLGRFAASLLAHKRRRKALLGELAELQHRVDLLHALTSTMPGLPGVAGQQQQQQQQQQQPGAVPGRPGSGGNNGARPGEQQFVLVDLPRVESGGFILQSPTPSSPAPELAAAQQVEAAVAAALRQQQLAQPPPPPPSAPPVSCEPQPLPQQQPLRPSAAMSGWGGVVMQQQQRTLPQPLQQQQQQQQQPSPRSEDGGNGSLAEQQQGGSGGAAPGERLSAAASSSSDEGVLLERE